MDASLARERTILAWRRTGASFATAAAFAVAAVEPRPTGAAVAIAWLLGAGACLAAGRRRAGTDAAPTQQSLRLLAAALVTTAAVLAAA
jgi:uncharacterized membrane protein YidH (DUF202 family)